MSIDKNINSCDMFDSLNTLSLRKTRHIKNTQLNKINKDISKDSLLEESKSQNNVELEYFQQLKIETQMRDINSNSTLNIHSLQQVLSRFAVVLGKQHVWLSTRMDSIESLCKEFIDQDDKDDLLDDNVSERSDQVPEVTNSNSKLLGKINNKNSSLTNLNDDIKSNQVESNYNMKFTMNKGNSDLIQNNQNDNTSKIENSQKEFKLSNQINPKSSLSNQRKQEELIVFGDKNNFDVKVKNTAKMNSLEINENINIINNNSSNEPNEIEFQKSKSQKSNNLIENAIRDTTPTPDNQASSTNKSFKSQKFDEESDQVKHLYKEGDQDEKVIEDIKVDTLPSEPIKQPTFKKPREAKSSGGGNANALEKTISKVRESLLTDIESFCQDMIETSVKKNFASLNITQMLKVPENKIDPIRLKLAELYKKFDQQNLLNKELTDKISNNQANLQVIISRLDAIENSLNHKANDSDINDLQIQIKKLITRDEYEELKTQISQLIDRNTFDETKNKLEEFISDVEKNQTLKILTQNIKEDHHNKFTDINTQLSEITNLRNNQDNLQRSVLSNNQFMMKLDKRMMFKFDEIDNNFKLNNQILQTKENLSDSNIIREKMDLLETKERVDKIENEVLPVINKNKERLDECENNTINFFREIQRLEEKVENKPDRQEIEKVDRKVKNSVDKEVQNTVLNKYEELCNNLDNRVKQLDNNTRFSREDFNSRIENLRNEFVTMSQDQAKRDTNDFSPLKSPKIAQYGFKSSIKSNNNPLPQQAQYNKNILLIILGLLKFVFQKDNNILNLKDSLYSSAQNLQSLTSNHNEADSKQSNEHAMKSKLDDQSSLIIQNDGTFRTEHDSNNFNTDSSVKSVSKLKQSMNMSQSNERYKNQDQSINRPKSSADIKKRLSGPTKITRHSQSKVNDSLTSIPNLNLSMTNMNKDSNNNQISSSFFPNLKKNQ